jgi:hypothetical protein
LTLSSPQPNYYQMLKNEPCKHAKGNFIISANPNPKTIEQLVFIVKIAHNVFTTPNDQTHFVSPTYYDLYRGAKQFYINTRYQYFTIFQ